MSASVSAQRAGYVYSSAESSWARMYLQLQNSSQNSQNYQSLEMDAKILSYATDPGPGFH